MDLFSSDDEETLEVSDTEKALRRAQLAAKQEDLFSSVNPTIPGWLARLGYDPKRIVTLDLGGDGRIFAHDVNGPVDIPRSVGRGLRPIHKNTATLRWALTDHGFTVMESATVGSSGFDREAIRDLLPEVPGVFLKNSNRTVKNTSGYWCRGWSSRWTDEEAAWIIYLRAAANPDGLSLWRYRSAEEVRQWKSARVHWSVRPYDSYKYDHPDVVAFMEPLPLCRELPEISRVLFGGDGYKGYAVSRVLPLAMALDEAGSETRKGYENILGLWENGAPSFYRRCTNGLREYAEKNIIANVSKKSEVSFEERKAAHQLARKEIRRLYYYMMNKKQLFPTLLDL